MTTSPEPSPDPSHEPPPGSQLADFAGQLTFRLDPFQMRACEALERGHGVLVCAPTGAGKTVVGEFAVHLALAAGTKCFYTAPIKALSNQKHSDLVRRYGAERIGLLTGDQSINGDAPVVVMTTEVLRNMLYAGSEALRGLSHVVMDEVHFLADRMRGAVWEEVILHLPEEVRLVSLSATVSNAEEFGEWLAHVRGAVEARNMAKLADLGFRFSIDKIQTLDLDFTDLQRSDVKFVKVSAELLLEQLLDLDAAPANPRLRDIHPGDFAELARRYGLEVIAEKVEAERQIIDILELDIALGQGHLFGEPRAIKEQVLAEAEPPSEFVRNTLIQQTGGRRRFG